MRISCERMGTTHGHVEQGPTPVDAYTLDTGQGLAIKVMTYGATLLEVLVPDRAGRSANVVVRLPDLPSYENREINPYLGATIGRYARCIATGSFRLDGILYELDRNFDPHHNHGGTIGFDRFVWNAESSNEKGCLVLRLRLNRPHGDQGYPGALEAETIYRVAGGILSFEHRATTSASTVVALTNHTFWNLAASGSIGAHLLTINAKRLLMVDKDLIPVGQPVPVTGTSFDYTSPRAIGEHHLDHCFVLDDATWAAELSDPASGRRMRLRTDQPGLQVYSADAFREPRIGLSLQTGTWPDSANRVDFPSPRLDPGMTYCHWSTHEFSVA